MQARDDDHCKPQGINPIGLATSADLANLCFFGWLKPLQCTYGIRHIHGGSAVSGHVCDGVDRHAEAHLVNVGVASARSLTGFDSRMTTVAPCGPVTRSRGSTNFLAISTDHIASGRNIARYRQIWPARHEIDKRDGGRGFSHLRDTLKKTHTSFGASSSHSCWKNSISSYLEWCGW
jgi:hypothetical protein